MRIEATYLGKFFKWGYVPGQTFVLQVLTNNLGEAPRIAASMPPGTLTKYPSWKAFWKDWKRNY